MSKNLKLITGFIAGAAAGAALTIFAKSPKGKELTNKVSTMASDLKSATKEVVDEEINALYNKSKDISAEASALAKEISTFAKSKMKELKQPVNGTA